eukprot:CAMPEP_0179363288 /NCGR_PEP_ID=MMETSP0797-20121207/81452_1 /TAXON_ID=47934 /ORGANISM="Dinophysis acuminata, Strain DAEP01" /LENGTH=93 /DNA_ID=CAMNT_0021078743 /DNA_START=112 /DNA_END=394 /DNA_ORIENTATION=-
MKSTCTRSSSDDAILAPGGAPSVLANSAPSPRKDSDAPSTDVFLGSFSSSSASESDDPGAHGPKSLASPELDEPDNHPEFDEMVEAADALNVA